MRGHKSTKRLYSFDNVKNEKAKLCKICQYENNENSYNDYKELAKKKGIRIGLSESQFNIIIAKGKAKGRLTSQIRLKCVCPNSNCKYSWWRSIENTQRSLAGCSICIEKSKKNQKIT